MRLHRSIVQTVKFAIAHPFQRRQVIKILTTGLHSELIEVPCYVLGTYVQCCGKSNVASAASDVEETTKGARRVTKGERKLVVESYVKKFKEMNDGKFPTVSDAQREVGGSFYTLREILLELKSNPGAPLKGQTSVEKVNSKKYVLSTNTEKTIRTKDEIEYEQKSKVDSTVSIPKSLESKEKAESSCAVQDIRIDDDQLSSSVNYKSKDSEHHPRHPFKGLESGLNSDPECKLECDEVEVKKHESDGSERELKVPNEDNRPQRNTSMWQNLKSFANGILGNWRRF